MKWTMAGKYLRTPKKLLDGNDSDLDEYQPNVDVSVFPRRRTMNSSRPAKVVERHQFTIAHPDPLSGFRVVSNESMAHPSQFQSIDQISGIFIPKHTHSGSPSMVSNVNKVSIDSISGSSVDASEEIMDQSIDSDHIQSPPNDQYRFTPKIRVPRGVDMDGMTVEEREKYLEKRHRNNVAVRKSRDKAKLEKKDQEAKTKILQVKYAEIVARVKDLERDLELEKKKNFLLNAAVEQMQSLIQQKPSN